MLGMDLLIINIGGTRKKIYQELSKDYSAVDTPFWAAITAGYLRDKGFSVDILDANADNLTFFETAQRVKNLTPRFTAIVVYSQQANVCSPIMVGVRELCDTIKKIAPEQKIILSGWHPSALPEKTLREEQCDFVIEGEGFYTLFALLDGVEKSKICGLWWRHHNRIYSNPRSKNVQNLTTELQNVAWDLLPMNEGKYRAFNWMCLGDLKSRNNFASMFTSLGCPFKCSFCAIHSTYGEHKLRCWSPEWTLDQFDILINRYQVRNINLHDELFIYRKDHYLPIAQGIIDRKYNINIASFARVDVLHKISVKELSFLKKAGFNWFKLGIETGNTDILKKNTKGSFTKDIIKEVVNKVHNAGINLCANFMFGLPGDTMETMQANFDFAMELQCAFPSFFCTMAIPGSELYTSALEKKLPLPNTWLGYASQGYEFLPLQTENLSSADILDFRDKVFNSYFTDQAYLNMIDNKFGSEARAHIQGMTGIKIKRKILGD